MPTLEEDLRVALLDLYKEWLTIDYRAARFRPMLNRKGSVESVKRLLSGKLSEKSGFIRLVRAGKLEWTVESLICSQRKWRPLFSDVELAIACSRVQTALLLMDH